jgi:hypothetical protein
MKNPRQTAKQVSYADYSNTGIDLHFGKFISGFACLLWVTNGHGGSNL